MLKKSVLLALASIVFVISAQSSKVSASISACTANVDRSTIQPNQNESYNFEIANGDTSNAVIWVKITRPSGDFVIENGHTWSYSNTASEITFTGGTLSPSSSETFNLNASSGASDTSSANWTVEVSDDAGGADPTTCTGSLGTAIYTPPPDPIPPVISDIVITDIAETSARITWVTDLSSDSSVDYGLTNEYTSSKNEAARGTSHSVTLNSLTANTTYHAKLRSIDALGVEGSTDDFTFTTAKAGTTTTTTTTVTVTNTETETEEVIVVVTVTPIPDITAPTITVETDLSASFKVAPEVKGAVEDEKGLQSIEYTVDDGRHWTSVDPRFENGVKKVNFSFTPPGLFDGNYLVRVRAKDTSANIKESPNQTLIIDRLPPQLGGGLFSVGPQIITPAEDGILYTIKGMRTRVNFSGVGGIVTAKLESNGQAFPLQNVSQTGLWSSQFWFDTEGKYEITTQLLDGAGNRSTQNVGTIQVLDSGQVHHGDQPLESASVSVYVLQQSTQKFVLWDGVSYGQENPLFTTPTGEYAVLLPPGTYYIAIEKPGFRVLRSEIFTLEITTPITQDFSMEKRREIVLGSLHIPLFDFLQTSAKIVITDTTKTESPWQSVIGKEFPFFTLPTSDSVITLDQLKGKPTVLTVLSLWTPQTNAQMQVFEELYGKENFQVGVIMLHESISAVNVFAKRSEYQTKMIVDTDGVLVPQLPSVSLPTHYFLNRHGIVQSVKTGILSKEEILDTMVY